MPLWEHQSGMGSPDIRHCSTRAGASFSRTFLRELCIGNLRHFFHTSEPTGDPLKGEGLRYFHDALDSSPALAAEGVERAGRLFAIEARIKGADAETRARVRARETRGVLEELHTWCTSKVHSVRPSAPIGRAFQYVLGQWNHLVVCADHPGLPIHNNMSELQLRRPVVGRKNWLFAGSEGGARTAAILYSLTGSCRLHGIDPWAYLHDVLGRINDHPVNRIRELSPANWKPL